MMDCEFTYGDKVDIVLGFFRGIPGRLLDCSQADSGETMYYFESFEGDVMTWLPECCFELLDEPMS